MPKGMETSLISLIHQKQIFLKKTWGSISLITNEAPYFHNALLFLVNLVTKIICQIVGLEHRDCSYT